jgi:hypothetical protein
VTEPELRALVREVVARHVHPEGAAPEHVPAVTPSSRRHASHAMFLLPEGSDTDGPCLIEPAVMCNHCGYCKSYGH